MVSCVLTAPQAHAQGTEESAVPNANQSSQRDNYDVGAEGGGDENAPSVVPNSPGDNSKAGSVPALQGTVTRTAPGGAGVPGAFQMPPNQVPPNQLPYHQYPSQQYQTPPGQPVPFPHYPQGYVLQNNFNAPSGFVPQQGLTPPYQPNFVPPQTPPDVYQSGSAQTDKSADRPKGGLFGSAIKSLLNGAVNQNNAPPAERPWWIPGNAFTNDSMVAPYHAMDIFWWDKRPIPNKPQMVRLSTSVSRFWRGNVSEPCFVLVEPDPRAPGNFTFQSRQPNGPRGWLQALDKPDPSGFPQYRYWLDQ